MERVVRSTRPTVIVDGTGFSPFPSSFLTARLPSGSQEVSLAGEDGWSATTRLLRARIVLCLVRNFPMTQDDYPGA